MDRQKKLLIFGAAWFSALLLTWFLYAKTVAPQRERTVPVVVASRDMPLGALLRPGDLKMVDYPERHIPRGVLLDGKNAVNRVLLVPVYMNEPLLLSKLTGATNVEGVSSTIE